MEPLDWLYTFSFINPLSRFSSICGTFRFHRSNKGTNFVGACNELSGIDLNKVTSSLSRNSVTGVMNPPSSSHHGGIWERCIRSIRRVLEGTLEQLAKRGLIRDNFVTLLQESATVVNNTPLWAVSSDTSDLLALSPATLFTPNAALRDTFTASDLDSYGPCRYCRVQYLANQFSIRRRREHLHQLTLQRKWQHPTRSFAVGDVLVHNALAARHHWETYVSTKSFSVATSLFILLICPSLIPLVSAPGAHPLEPLSTLSPWL